MSEQHAEQTTTEAAISEPTGPGTSTAAQEQLKATEKPPSSILTEVKPEEKPAEAPPAFAADKITFPEGFDKNAEIFGKFSEIAAANGLTLPVAQQLSDLYVAAAKQFSTAGREAWNTTLAGWETEVKADTEIAKAILKTAEGSLSGLDAVKATVAKVLDNPALTHPKFREALEVTGIGSHPAAVRTLYNWAKALTEGGAVQGNGPPNKDSTGNPVTRPTAAAALYPNNPRAS